MSLNPEKDPGDLIRANELGREPEGWESHVRDAAGHLRPDHPSGKPEQLVAFLMGKLMPGLRGKVAAGTVRFLLEEMVGGGARNAALILEYLGGIETWLMVHRLML